MKNHIFEDLKRNLARNPSLKRKLKIFLGVSIFGVLLTIAGAIFATVVGVKHLYSIGKTVDTSQVAESFNTTIENLPSIANASCLEAALNLLNIESFVFVNLSKNFNTLKNSCLKIDQTTPLKTEE